MTAEEIKETVSMRDVLARYGVEVGANGMCKCPIHNERHPSMKVYADGYKCFACGSGGDIFRFVQDMEGCDFKQAFIILGGTYKKHTTKTAKANAKAHFDRIKKRKEQAAKSEKDFRAKLMDAISFCEDLIDQNEPLSDNWCKGQKWLPWLWYVFEAKYIEGEEIDELNVLRAYRKIRQGHNTT